MKPGYATTEFWLTAAALLLSLLAHLGVVAPADADALTRSVGQIGTGIVAAASIWKYIQSRMEQKIVAQEIKDRAAKSPRVCP